MMQWRGIALGAIVSAGLLVAGCEKESGPVRTVAITVDDQGFHPSSVPAKTGETVALAFTRTTEQTCAREVEFPSLRKKKVLPLNKTVVVKVTPERVGNIDFSCQMKMWAGSVEVE
jgi:plastocyanin domain-containing protein